MAVAGLVKSSSDGAIVTLSICEHFDYRCIQSFRMAYEQNMQDDVDFVVDFTKTLHVDSCALGLLISLHKYLEKKQSQLTLVNCSTHVRKIFSMMQFDKKLRIE